MKHHTIFLVVLLLVAGVWFIPAVTAEEEEIALSEVPEVVIAAAKKAVKGIVLTKAEKETTDDGVIYEVGGTAKKKAYDLSISSDGEVLSIEVEVALSDVPKKVIAAAKKAVPGIELTKAEKEKTKKGVFYELEGKLGDKEYEILITPAGKVIEIEVDDEADDEDEEGDDDDDDDEEDEDEED